MAAPAFTGRRVAKGQRDPVALNCCCPQEDAVLLFYRYFAASPILALDDITKHLSSGPTVQEDLASFQLHLCTELGLKGKVRVGLEGFNISLVGTRAALHEYMRACCGHWSFSGLELDTKEQRGAFFKPTPACLCAFTSLSVKVVDEIVPLHLDTWVPSVPTAASELNYASSSHVDGPMLQYLEPAEFHRFLLDDPTRNATIVDVRNQYESRLGTFPHALQPPTRRFSEFPAWLEAAHVGQADNEQKPVVTFCTGGIRCEKAGRYVASKVNQRVYTLKGGIEAYLEWVRQEIQHGRMQPHESLFHGRNMVFDSRGSTGMQATSDLADAPICMGERCQDPTWRLGHCAGIGCNIILSVCEACTKTVEQAWCCPSCQDVSSAAEQRGGRRKGTCLCEKQRQQDLLDGKSRCLL